MERKSIVLGVLKGKKKMFNKYFVLVTEKYFGVFEVNARWYSDEFLDNISSVCVMDQWDIMPHLLKHVGRNVLIKSGFKGTIESVGRIYTR